MNEIYTILIISGIFFILIIRFYVYCYLNFKAAGVARKDVDVYYSNFYNKNLIGGRWYIENFPTLIEFMFYLKYIHIWFPYQVIKKFRK